MSKQYDVCILGATGAVGEAMLSIRGRIKFPVPNLYPLASSRSAGSTVSFKGEDLTVIDVEGFDFSKTQIGLFSAGGSVSEKYAPIAAAAGCVVIDNTAHFRYDRDIPLVVPEVNPHAIAQYKNRGIIANPNCSTIQMLVVLKPIQDAVGIARINVATYQAVSGTGHRLISRHIDTRDAYRVLDRLEYHQHLDGRAVRIGDDAAIFVLRDGVRIHLRHHQRNIAVVTEVCG